MDLREKIKAARNVLGITQDELAKYSGMSIQNIKKLETKENVNPTNKTLQKLAIALKVDNDYFVSQCLPMSPNIENNVSQSIYQSDKNVPKLSLSKKNNVSKSDRFVSDSLVQSNRFVSDSLVKKDDTIQVPIYDVYASAGSGLLNDEQVKEYVGLDKSFLRQYFGLSSFLELSIITARGDSMMPTIPENCQLLIQKSQSFQEGQICVVRIDDELYVKRLQKRPRYKLLSDNKAYDDIELEGEDYEIIGIVVGMFKKML